MAPKLYVYPASYPARSTLLTAEALGLKVDIQLVDLMKGEHLKPEYLKLNPRHQVPVLDDNGFILCESTAICCYLVEKYGKDDTLYPKDLTKRSIVNERLFFHSGYLFQKVFNFSMGVLFMNWKSFPQDALNQLAQAYEFVEGFLGKSKYVAGDSITIADLNFLATITSGELFVKVDKGKYPKLSSWLENMKKQSFYHVNKEGCEQYYALIKTKMATP